MSLRVASLTKVTERFFFTWPLRPGFAALECCSHCFTMFMVVASSLPIHFGRNIFVRPWGLAGDCRGCQNSLAQSFFLGRARDAQFFPALVPCFTASDLTSKKHIVFQMLGFSWKTASANSGLSEFLFRSSVPLDKTFLSFFFFPHVSKNLFRWTPRRFSICSISQLDNVSGIPSFSGNPGKPLSCSPRSTTLEHS